MKYNATDEKGTLNQHELKNRHNIATIFLKENNNE